jgi:hypothetical protein
MKIAIRLFAVGLITSLLAGCESRSSPSDALRAAYLAANAGDYAKAQSYMTSALHPAAPEDTKGAWQRITRNGTLKSVDIVKEELPKEERPGTSKEQRQEIATVRFRMTFTNGATEEDVAYLVQEKGAWKIR